ncbi:MAG TPA: lysophospholipid acyltransferase family protein [Steroidobacteraceae bacterium]
MAADSRAGRSTLWLRLVAHLPWEVLYPMTAVLAFILRHVLRYRVAVARANLCRCFPTFPPAEIESVLGAYYRHLGQVIAELMKLANISAEELRRRVRFTNSALVNAEINAGRSVILVAAHLANWEWQLQAVALEFKVPTDAAYKPLHSAGADRELLKLRSRFGARMIAAKRLVRTVARRRRELHAIALMADQIPASSAGRQWVSFLGTDTAFYPGPAEIARMTGYATFFTAMRRTSRGHYEMTFYPLAAAGECLQPEIFTERYARILETQIRAEPADWMWTHRRWKLAAPVPLIPSA